MPKPKLAPPPTTLCYDCHGCGTCCRGYFRIQVTDEERERILAQGWDELGLDPLGPFERTGDGWVLRHHDDGGCVFLDEEGRCRIHARHGEAAKPLACRLYPFVFVPAGDEVRIDVRFDCPSAAGSRGRQLQEHFSALQELLPLAVPNAAEPTPPPAFTPSRTVDWATLGKVSSILDRVLGDISLSLTQRVQVAVALSAMLRYAPIDTLRGKELDEYLRALCREATEALLAEPPERTRPARPVRVMFRQLAGLYGRADRAGEGAQVPQRLGTALKLVLGAGTVPAIRADFPQVSFEAVERVSGRLPLEAAAVFTRYYRTRLASHGFFGPGFHGRSYLDSLDALLLTFPLLMWYARLFAAGAGRDAPAEDDAIRALTLIDHQHGRNPFLDTAAERKRRETLTETDTLLQLIAWYGEEPAGEA